MPLLFAKDVQAQDLNDDALGPSIDWLRLAITSYLELWPAVLLTLKILIYTPYMLIPLLFPFMGNMRLINR